MVKNTSRFFLVSTIGLFLFVCSAVRDYPQEKSRTTQGEPLTTTPTLTCKSGKAYFFNQSEYLRYDVVADRVDPGYPQPISRYWNLPENYAQLSATTMVNWENCKAYFFHVDLHAGNSTYIRYDMLSDRVEVGPEPVWDNWPGVDNVEAAVNWGNGKVYFFRGDHYIRYDIAADRADFGPRPIIGNWPGWPKDWGQPDAAVNWRNGKVYFFKGDQYIRYDIATDRVDLGPRPIIGNWPGWPQNWKAVTGALYMGK